MSQATIPELEPRCASWIIVDRVTDDPVMETFSRRVALAINQDRYEVLTATGWLQRFNARVRGK